MRVKRSENELDFVAINYAIKSSRVGFAVVRAVDIVIVITRPSINHFVRPRKNDLFVFIFRVNKSLASYWQSLDRAGTQKQN